MCKTGRKEMLEAAARSLALQVDPLHCRYGLRFRDGAGREHVTVEIVVSVEVHTVVRTATYEAEYCECRCVSGASKNVA